MREDASQTQPTLARTILGWTVLILFFADLSLLANHPVEILGYENASRALCLIGWVDPKDAFNNQEELRDELGSYSELRFVVVRKCLDHGFKRAASSIAQGIVDADTLIEMHADKRFDEIIAADPGRFDVQRAWANNIAELKKEAARELNKLEGTIAAAKALIRDGRPEEALDLIDSIVSRANPTKSKQSPFNDYKINIPWALNARADALFELGRYDEAIDVLKYAATLPEKGKDQSNVSQTLNLAGYLNRLGRPNEALATAARVKFSQMKPHGVMVQALVRACAYAQLRDSAKLNDTMTYIREHNTDIWWMTYYAAICANDLDAAADLILLKLQDPDSRPYVLATFQDYLPASHATSIDVELNHRRRGLRARDDIAAIISRVGRIESYSLSAVD